MEHISRVTGDYEEETICAAISFAKKAIDGWGRQTKGSPEAARTGLDGGPDY